MYNLKSHIIPRHSRFSLLTPETTSLLNIFFRYFQKRIMGWQKEIENSAVLINLKWLFSNFELFELFFK